MKEVYKAIELYDKTFDSFPTIPLLRDYPDEEVIEMINECIKNNKDVYEMGFLDIDLLY